ncbi:hypothetical protein SKAU_G00155140 [Synaphobranchus kaupii]|uniref:Uncharacterized protein n=1 Tax=Synaphobranchus kaupii TaxID=118154 RepID=A0A9Q1FHR8_SYNKA|nr:hypothetical protein SKAU_G00155140 [Synaphobranchus kaupii]
MYLKIFSRQLGIVIKVSCQKILWCWVDPELLLSITDPRLFIQSSRMKRTMRKKPATQPQSLKPPSLQTFTHILKQRGNVSCEMCLKCSCENCYSESILLRNVFGQ